MVQAEGVIRYFSQVKGGEIVVVVSPEHDNNTSLSHPQYQLIECNISYLLTVNLLPKVSIVQQQINARRCVELFHQGKCVSSIVTVYIRVRSAEKQVYCLTDGHHCSLSDIINHMTSRIMNSKEQENVRDRSEDMT